MSTRLPYQDERRDSGEGDSTACADAVQHDTVPALDAVGRPAHRDLSDSLRSVSPLPGGLHHRESSSARQQRQAEESLCRKAFLAARKQASHYDLRREDAEDATFGFILHLLALLRSGCLPGVIEQVIYLECLTLSQEELLERWLTSCAINWIKNVCLGLRRRLQHEQCFTDIVYDLFAGSEDIPLSQGIFLTFGASPLSVKSNSSEVILIRVELIHRFWQAVAVARLKPRQWFLLQEYYFGETTIAQIAATSDKPSNTVRQELFALRRRLQISLEDEGINATESAAYLAIIANRNIILTELFDIL